MLISDGYWVELEELGSSLVFLKDHRQILLQIVLKWIWRELINILSPWKNLKTGGFLIIARGIEVY